MSRACYAPVYLRAKKRNKDGKEHRYWSIVESCRNQNGRVVQRPFWLLQIKLNGKEAQDRDLTSGLDHLNIV